LQKIEVAKQQLPAIKLRLTMILYANTPSC